MWLGGEETESGRRVHRLVAAALEAERDGEHFDVVAAVRTMFRAAPLGAGATHALRFRCSSAANVYLLRCRPLGWDLVGVEVRLGAAVADLVWSDGDRFVIDELKSGAPRARGGRVADQLTRLACGGTERWGAAFAGVRLVPLAAPRTTSFHRLIDSQLHGVALPAGMEVRP